MPIYEYICMDCDEEFEVSGSFDFLENYEPVCPKCWKENIVRVYTPVATIFKGKDFYKTESREKENEEEIW